MLKHARSIVASLTLFAGLVALVGCDSPAPVSSKIQDDVIITQAAFDETVSQTDRAVLVKFGAPWCPPCNMIDKELPELAAEMGSELEIVKINVDNHAELAQQYNITSIPRLILFRDGEAISNRVGYFNAGELASWIRNSP